MDLAGWQWIGLWLGYVVPLIVTTWYAAWVGRNPSFWFAAAAVVWPLAIVALVVLNAVRPRTPVDDPYGTR